MLLFFCFVWACYYVSENYCFGVVSVIGLIFAAYRAHNLVCTRGGQSPKKYEAIGNHQGVVVLSGSVGTLKVDESIIVEWGDPDRFFAGLNAFHSKKADKVIFTRGKMPWSNSDS